MNVKIIVNAAFLKGVVAPRDHISTSSEMELFCQEINTLLDKVSEMTAERLQDQTRLYEMNLAKKRAELPCKARLTRISSTTRWTASAGTGTC